MKKQSINWISGTWAKWSIALCVLFSTNLAKADNDVIPDTVHVKEVVVTSKTISRYQVGAKIETIPLKQFQDLQDGSLEQLIIRYTPIAIKGNAGGLSTMRLRGTSPDHTSINFGSININSLTLGHSNVSNVPLYLFDEVALQYGSASVMNGSGSIGGAIHLGMQNYWIDGVKAEARIAVGSFGEQLYGAKVFLGNGKFEAVTRAFLYAKHNRFTFMNDTYRDFKNQIFEIADTQQNANIENKGIIQEFNYKIAPKHIIKTKFWFEKDWHLVQQNVQTNLNSPDKRETYEDNHVRIWTDYDNRTNKLKYHIGAGYVFDQGIHNGTSDPIQTQRGQLEGFVERNVWLGANIKTGIDVSRIFPKVYAYSTDLNYEDRTDLFVSIRQDVLKTLKLTLNVRKGFVTNFEVPFTPAIGFSYMAYRGEATLLKFTGNIARSYSVPTFNDRYWDPGGNPDLKPEDGINYEIGSEFNYCNGVTSGIIKVNFFYMDVDNWVMWRPGGSFWYAENEEHVISKGLELQGDMNWKVARVKLEHGFVFSYNSAQSIIDGSSNRQLEYVPLFMTTLFSGIRVNQWNAGFDGRFTPWLYTDKTDGNILDAYFLLNIHGGYHWNLPNSQKLKILAHVNNLFNVDYQSSYGYAMPGINYRISVTYNFN